jgi:hypothetical protein
MYFELLGLRGQPELDMVFVDQPVVEVALPARLARLEGKRVPAEREAGTTVEVSVDRVLLRTGAGLAPGDNLVLELELPDRGWTRSLWAKVLEVDAAAGTALLAVTSAEPDDLDALRGLAS